MRRELVLFIFLIVSFQLNATDRFIFLPMVGMNQGNVFIFSDLQHDQKMKEAVVYLLPLDSSISHYNNKIANQGSYERHAFLIGFFGQTWGLLAAAADGSATQPHFSKFVNRGFLTGLGVWTGCAIGFGIKTVAIIYGCAYGLPVVIIGFALVPTLFSSWDRDIKKIKLFSESNDAWILKDSSVIQNENRIPVQKLPRRVFKPHGEKIAKEEIMNAYKIDVKDTVTNKITSSYYAIEIISSAMIYKFDSENKQWYRNGAVGHRYQFYDKSGSYLGVRYLSND